MIGRQLDAARPMLAEPTPPKTPGLPLIGALPALIARPFDFLLEARARHGDVYALDLGLFKLVVLAHPRHAEQIFLDNSRNYVRSGPVYEAGRSFLGNGLATSDGDFWLRQRRLMQPQFHRKRLATLTEIMVATIEAELADWAPAADAAAPFDLLRAFNSITMKVIVRTMFGTSLNRQESDDVGKEMALAANYLLLGALTSALPRWLPVPGARRYRQALQKIDAVLSDVITGTRQAGGDADNLIAMFLHMVDAETGAQMTDQQLRDEAVTIFFGGYETTSLMLSWAFHFLTQHPEMLDRLQAEVDAALGTRLPTFADLPALPYTSMILQETVRLRPPAWFITRTAVAADVIDGFAIPAGATVGVLPYLVHRHPDYWANPEQFDPQRFAPECSADRHRFAWMPFGAGQHQCIGKDFAMMEAQLILAMLLQRYRVTAAPGHTTRPQLSATLKPKGGVFVNLARR